MFYEFNDISNISFTFVNAPIIFFINLGQYQSTFKFVYNTWWMKAW